MTGSRRFSGYEFSNALFRVRLDRRIGISERGQCETGRLAHQQAGKSGNIHTEAAGAGKLRDQADVGEARSGAEAEWA
jgi:hypothetical protein